MRIKLIWKIKDKEEETDLEEEIIIKVIKNLETKKATGPDGISNDMVLEGGNSLKNSIIRMMKIIYRTKEIPKDWNAAYIKNIYKGKGSKKHMGNYRGIILNSHIAKIFEKILAIK